MPRLTGEAREFRPNVTRTITIRVRKHLTPVFAGTPLAAITTAHVRQYIAHRQAQGASNATVNRDLIALKRMCSLALQAGTLMTRPYIPLLRERNIRTGFFERA